LYTLHLYFELLGGGSEVNSERGSADLTPHIYSKRPNKGEYRAGTESGCTVASVVDVYIRL